MTDETREELASDAQGETEQAPPDWSDLLYEAEDLLKNARRYCHDDALIQWIMRSEYLRRAQMLIEQADALVDQESQRIRNARQSHQKAKS